MKLRNLISNFSLFLLLSVVPSFSNIIRVPQDHSSIQQAIDAANDLDTVLVEPGWYKEQINFKGKSIVVGSLFITTGDTNYIFLTGINGDWSGTVVTFESGEDENAVLSGFTIQYGTKAGIKCLNSSNPRLIYNIIRHNWNHEDAGGGINVYKSDPLIENCKFYKNQSLAGGGGLYTYQSNIIIRDCLFQWNTSSEGGAAWIYESHAIITNCQFIENEADWSGAIYFRGSSAVLDSVLFEKNQATMYHGGAFECEWSLGLHMSNTIIRENTAEGSGGGFWLDWGTKSDVQNYLEDVTLIGNSAQKGGGIYTHSSDFITKNLVFANNQAEIGGGIFLSMGNSNIINSVFTGNVADTGSAIHCYGGDHVLINSILWNNISPEVTFTTSDYIKSMAVAYSDIENGLDSIFPADSTDIQWLEGNMDKDPLFVNPGEGDYHLKEDSPCIDAGTAFFVYDGDTIVNFQPGQYNGSAPDMGAFEFGPPLDIEDKITNINSYELYQNYPNPFNPVTMISYQLSMTNEVNLSIYNILGQKVVTLVSERQEAGHHQVEWAASRYASGVYYYHFQANGFQDVKKMILLR